jgi:hypothetical protein
VPLRAPGSGHWQGPGVAASRNTNAMTNFLTIQVQMGRPLRRPRRHTGVQAVRGGRLNTYVDRADENGSRVDRRQTRQSVATSNTERWAAFPLVRRLQIRSYCTVNSLDLAPDVRSTQTKAIL